MPTRDILNKQKMARTIGEQTYGSGRNKIVDAFIEVLEENPEIEIINISGTRVDWRFKIDSPSVQKIADGVTDWNDMDKKQRRAYDKLEKKYQKKAIKEAKTRIGGTKQIIQDILGDEALQEDIIREQIAKEEGK